MSDPIKPVIVIPAYKRAVALNRLLNSILCADCPANVRLIISLEGGCSEDVRQVAYGFNAINFQIEVIQRPERLGLRKHILACGDLTTIYGAAIILEDDLIVDRYFYSYAIAALNYYDKDTAVGGIALYACEYNEFAALPFTPMGNGYATYPMQIPCSWGQCWSSKQWLNFKSWYDKSDIETVNKTVDLPEEVKSWPESSWKKYFAAYLIHKNLYFIYPYQSYTTNCADAGGTHMMAGSDIYQVCFSSQQRPLPSFTFCHLIDNEIAYDSFMEPCGAVVYRALELDSGQIEIDTLGIKNCKNFTKKYILTCRQTTKAIRYYPRSFRPIEHNFLYQLPDNTVGQLALILKNDFIYDNHYNKSVSFYAYYVGFDLESLRLIMAVLKSLPRLVSRKIISDFKELAIRIKP